MALSQNINYVSFPQAIASVNQSCQPSDKVLFLPTDNYLISSYSPRVFSIKPDIFLECPVYRVDYATLINTQDKQVNLVVTESQKSAKINLLVQDLVSGKISAEDFVAALKVEKITILVVEEYQNGDMQILRQKIQNLVPEKTNQASIYVFDI